MDIENGLKLYDISGKTAVITGGAGVLGATICQALAQAGAKIAILDLDFEAARKLADDIQAGGQQAAAVACNVLDRASVATAAQQVKERFGGVDILINGAGGNKAEGTTNQDHSFFDLPEEALRWIFDLNLMGTIIPSQIFSQEMARQNQGVILNISSMTAFRPLTRIAAYSAAKAGVSNFTQWLAVHLAQEYSTAIRVNALAPGFFLTEQNRFLLTDQETGGLTARGQAIIDHTPQGKFGSPEDLIGATLWLISPASSFVTGIVVPVDGGFSAYSGV
jgi:NAD(P)-dependent dehydrogenase (short-subunit alcohol dehydrogenase family)